MKAFNRETSKVAQAISWAMVRTVYYRSVAKTIGGEYFPHPMRSMMNAKCILFDNFPGARNRKINTRMKCRKYRPDLSMTICYEKQSLKIMLAGSITFSGTSGTRQMNPTRT